jgi:hypothetical protein
MMLAYLVGGYSSSGPARGWRYYRISDLRDVQMLKEGFGALRADFDPQDPRFVAVYCRVTSR